MPPDRRSKSPRASDPVERLRAICLALPEATEKLAWGEPTWRVRGKLFAQLDDHHHGADHLAVWLPAPLGEQEAMIFVDPVRFFRPPYVGQRGWVGMRIDRDPDWNVVATVVAQAYRMIAPPRLRAAVAGSASADPLGTPERARRAALPRRDAGAGARGSGPSPAGRAVASESPSSQEAAPVAGRRPRAARGTIAKTSSDEPRRGRATQTRARRPKRRG